jgi:hypothetical protein
MTIPGHYDDMLSQYASKNLIHDVDVNISAVIANHPYILVDAIPICLVDTIQEFDTTLRRTMMENTREMDPKPWKAMDHDDPYPIMRCTCRGTTVLIAVIISDSIWVASPGDSEGC